MELKTVILIGILVIAFIIGGYFLGWESREREFNKWFHVGELSLNKKTFSEQLKKPLRWEFYTCGDKIGHIRSWNVEDVDIDLDLGDLTLNCYYALDFIKGE